MKGDFMLLDALNFFISILFPPCCGVCGKINKSWICNNCYNSLIRLKKVNDLETKNSFKNKNNLNNNLIYIFKYKGIIRTLILKYKFHNNAYLSNTFAEIILRDEKFIELFNNYDYIFPVPMHEEKRKQRGYNQTELILRKIFENEKYKNKSKFKIKLDSYNLKKIKNTKMQSTLSKTLRKENIKNAFLVNNKEKIINKKIIVFDDIYTTGETTKEISRILKEAGAKEVLIFVIAKD